MVVALIISVIHYLIPDILDYDDDVVEPPSKKMRLDNGDGVVDTPRYCEDLNQTSGKMHLQYDDDVVETPQCREDLNATSKMRLDYKNDVVNTPQAQATVLDNVPRVTEKQSVPFTASVKRIKSASHDRSKTQSNAAVIGSEMKYPCHMCTKTFQTKRGLSLHLNSHKATNSTNSVSNVNLHSKSLKLKQDGMKVSVTPIQQSFICPLCEHSFTLNKNRLLHLVTASCTRSKTERFLRRVTKGWACTSCDKVTGSESM